MMPSRKTHPLTLPVNKMLYDLPAPINISFMWNFGSMLGLCLTMQILSGSLLTMHYTPHTDMAFFSLAHITREVNLGWLMKSAHANGASMFFMSMYLHMGRTIYFNSYKRVETWNLGTTIFLLSMATAFMGYLLPWGQMSFWGATVITNMFSAIPYIGPSIVMWLWGGFAVSSPTLIRFFTLHFLLPFIISLMALLHLIFLHQHGSNNPLGLNANFSKIPFHPYFTNKDLLGFLFILSLLATLTFFYPNKLGEPENFSQANPLVTPTHIKPEWYFLWAYAILRSIPNKLGGVIMMLASITILYTLPMQLPHPITAHSSLHQLATWLLFSTFTILTWIGNSPVEAPYDLIGGAFTLLYFTLFLVKFIFTASLQHNLSLMST